MKLDKNTKGKIDKYFDDVSTQELLKSIDSKYFTWGGLDNGDEITKYQARKCQQMALALIITSRIMLMEGDESILTEESISYEQASDLFHNHIVTWGADLDGGMGTHINLKIIPNLYKLVAGYLPKENK